ncbi:GNAT family N-acetyltransferase [Paenibacillus hunanensis]|uniref:GNAT family N-acetyltransferase n=1 Tax=Paenibacillus hunanensis TaxID=539262 RepID=UPI002026403D|nr:GNAT family N-acetyltransferase [Paenibacillus hunanensis]MCL9659183.1 GNAT family N-acetyltransferase [Paenibacillus hunanensis]
MPDSSSRSQLPQYELQSASIDDANWIAELRALVLKDDLTRLNRYDEVRVRQRFLNSFQPDCTQVITVHGLPVGCIAMRPEGGGYVLEHFYIHPDHQGKGIGSAVLAEVLSDTRLHGQTVTLNVLQGSSARRLYERYEFKLSEQDEVDVFMKRQIEA